jgi:hypothetical protein
MAFTLAGFYWLFMYGFEMAGWISLDQTQTLRSGQTIIYFILLGAWGLEYLREARRLGILMETANSMGLPPEKISAVDLSGTKASFDVLMRARIARSSFLMPVLNIGALAISYYLVVKQYVNLIMMVI